MQINIAAQLTQQLNAGGHVTLSKNRLETQCGLSALLERVGDIFRSSQTIALRNERLALAVGYRLNSAHDNRQLQLFDLTHARGELDTKKFTSNIISSLTRDIIAYSCKDKMPLERENAQHFLAYHVDKYIKRNYDTPYLNIKSLKDIANIAVKRVIINQKETLDNLSMLNLEGVTEEQKNEVCKTIKQQIHTYIVEENKNNKLFTDLNIYTQSLTDVNRERPIFSFINNGNKELIHIDNMYSNTNALRSQFINLVSRITTNTQERRILSMLVSQTMLVPIAKILMASEDIPVRLGNKDTYRTDEMIRATNKNTHNTLRHYFTIDDENIFLRIKLPVTTTLTAGDFKNTDENTMGTISYDITIPRSEFYAQGEAPARVNLSQDDIANLHLLDPINDNGQARLNLNNLKITVNNMQITELHDILLEPKPVQPQQPILNYSLLMD
ncbi:MAG: hypothetical protein PHN64_08400 [Desulfovibrionaceae bacterium]|nr:hypothetical protein [Desulfovibrionaceae bacterium]